MKKRFLSLLCVLALCLGLLPVTALAAEGIKLFIGGQQITESGCYENKNGTWTKVDGTEPANGQFSYDAATFTLTLNEAEITNNQTVNVAEGYTYDGSVIAFSQTADVSLKIVVSQGTSTITGTGGIRVESTTGNASLSIKGSGSLDVEPKGSNSGITLCSSKNTNLDIDGADVTASSPAQYGVYLISSTDASSTSTITVNNGSLTTGGNGNVGIYYYWSGTSNAGTSSLTVSGNAVVDTRNSQIMAQNKETVVQVGAGSDGNGGIVFNGKSGTVYGDVTLQEDLEIGTDETLTIGKDASLTVPDGKTLTNKGTVTTEEGGTLTGNITNAPPKITTTSLSEGTVNTAYNQPLAADNNPTSWSVTNGTLPDGLTLNSDGTITGTPSAVGSSTFTVTATNKDSGSDSKEFTLTINPAPVLVNSVTLNKSELALYTGGSATLTATVQPEDATNKAVNWSSSDEAVATVDTNGKVTAVGEGNATITATAADGSTISATCTVTVTQSTYSISADTKTLDFGSVYTGYTQPAAQTVMITNTGNQSLTLNQPASTNSFEVGTLSKTALAVGETATFTVQPKAGLAVGTYSENITVSGSEGATVTIPAGFTVEQRDNTPYYGITVNDLANGTVTCYAKSAAKGAEVTLTVKPDVGYALDKLTVTDASGKTVDVTKVDEKTYTFVMPGSKVTVEAVFAPTTVEPSDLPFTDVSTSDWFYSAVKFVYENGLMDGVGNNLFAPNATLNRAMAVTILYRLEGSPDLDGENLGYPFADVDGNAWYGDAVYWARCNGIVDGVENNHFDPTGSLTREQMATVLYRYAQYKGADVSASGDISGFVDSANVSDWAVDAVKWAVGTGLVNGVEGNALAPQGTSTRAQAAAVLMRLSQAMGG